MWGPHHFFSHLHVGPIYLLIFFCCGMPRSETRLLYCHGI
jgi:hypothetical protein